MENEEKLTLSSDRKLPTSVMLKRMLPYLKKEIWTFVLSLILLLITVSWSIFMPRFEEFLIKELELGSSMILGNVIAICIGYIAFGAITSICSYLNTLILASAGERIVKRLRMEIFHHIESMSQNQLAEMPVGSLVTRVANYTTNISNLFVNTIVNILVNALTVIGVYVIMMVISPILGLSLLGFVVVLFVVSFFFNRHAHKMFHRERKLTSDFNAFMAETLSGMKIVQIFNQEERKRDEFEGKNEELRKAGFSVTKAFAFYRPFVSFMHFAAIGVIFLVGPRIGLKGAEIIAFYLYLSRFFNPVQNIADQLNNIQRGSTALERIFNLLDVVPEVVDSEDAIELGEIEGKIEFRNVYFAYSGTDWVLKDVSFVIEPKTTAAFVGATGAGKTTILGLIARNFEPQKGEILIDDIPIRKIKIESLRSKLGQMLQDVFLFSGTVRENVTLYDESFKPKEVDDALAYVGADSFVNKLPRGKGCVLAERGSNLSQGQRQLLSFARTVLHEPSILVLDEATANIDTETEALIQESLEKMKSIGTMLVVAHRLSTIQKANQIIVLHKGEVMEKGTHQGLLKKRGLYYKLYQLQFEER